jgi:hypothetical protein
VSEAIPAATVQRAASVAPEIEVKLAGAVVRVSPGMSDIICHCCSEHDALKLRQPSIKGSLSADWYSGEDQGGLLQGCPPADPERLDDLARMFNPYIRSWINYSGHFYKSALYPTLMPVDALGEARKFRRRGASREARGTGCYG